MKDRGKEKEKEKTIDDRDSPELEILEEEGVLSGGTDNENSSNFDLIAKKLEEKEDRINELEDLLEKESQEKDKYCEALQRSRAEFSNYQKRMEREKQKSIKYANKDFAFDLLQVVDNLERALCAEEGEESSEVYKGVDLVLKQMKDVLKKNGIEEVNPLHEPFDMDFHEVVLKEEADYETDTVIEVLQKGYKIHGQILRPAMVKVAN